VPDIPMLAEGGIVTQATLAMIGEGNEPEAIIPLSKLGSMGFGGGGGNNITINVNGGDPNQVVAAIQRYVRQTGAVPLTTRAI
jgi:SLT domain-containing protein